MRTLKPTSSSGRTAPHGAREHARLISRVANGAPGASTGAAAAATAAAPTRTSDAPQQPSTSASPSAAERPQHRPALALGRPQLVVALGATLGLAGEAAYSLLSSQPELPPAADVLGALGAAAALALGSTALCLAVAKAAMGDRFHVELHRGRLYLCTGVPSSGPPLAPGAVEVRPTGDVRGNGAYATQLIPAGTHIQDYSGDLLDRAAFDARFPDGVGDYATAIDDVWVIDAARHVADTSRFHAVHMNHSAGRANVRRFYARAQKRVAFFAVRDVQPGEELLYDYGKQYWRGREHLELP